eukprot:scaffold12535_cov98-Cylindrotheca_fusiformis.AAC.3
MQLESSLVPTPLPVCQSSQRPTRAMIVRISAGKKTFCDWKMLIQCFQQDARKALPESLLTTMDFFPFQRSARTLLQQQQAFSEFSSATGH